MCICCAPFLCMSFMPTQSTTENKKLKNLPVLYDKKINVNYLNDLGEYFGDRFAFRTHMVNADSLVQGNVFGVSNMNTVVKGKNGWLYYTDTLDDYRRKNVLSERGVYNIASNLGIVQDFVNSKGSKLAVTIPPNKNSLYDGDMPYYYSKKAGVKKNMDKLNPLIKSGNLNYADLFEVFNNNYETLYLKRDSHWNNKGAMLAYNRIMDSLKREHNDYSETKSERKKTEYGDLNKMMYPLSAEPEWNYYYDYKDKYKYLTKTKSVEDPWIETENKNAEGTLLMFRDSFGNTLIPFFAREFKNSYFSKAAPYLIEELMNFYNPDCVVIEKVERNIDEFASQPPVMTSLAAVIPELEKNYKSETSLKADKTQLSASYFTLSGVVDKKFIKDCSNIYLSVISDGVKTSYKAFNISDKNGDNGYLLYLPKSEYENAKKIDVEVVAEYKGEFKKVKKSSVNLTPILK